MSQFTGFSHAIGVYDQASARWPDLPSRPVTAGGVTVTCAAARTAVAVLAAAGGIAVRQVLRAAGSPLAACDYHAAAAPYLGLGLPEASWQHRRPGRGAAGRPVTRLAFMAAVAAVLENAAAAEPGRVFAADLERAAAAFSRDWGYAAQMAAAAVQAASREHAAASRRPVLFAPGPGLPAPVAGSDAAHAAERAA